MIRHLQRIPVRMVARQNRDDEVIREPDDDITGMDDLRVASMNGSGGSGGRGADRAAAGRTPPPVAER